MLELANVQIGGDEDKVKWKMEKSGLYSTKSMYRLLSFEGVINKWLQKLWNNRTPTKLKVFLWLLFQNRLQSGEALKKKHWKRDGRCILCRVVESVDHIFFECVISSFVWCSCMEALGWDRPPANLADFLSNWLPLGCNDYHLKLFQFAVVTWAIWVNRNKMTIEKKNPCFSN